MTIASTPRNATNAPATRTAMPVLGNGNGNTQYEAAREVAPRVATPDAEITRYGSVSKVGSSDGSFFTVVLTPGTSADKTYIIGDPYNLIEAASGRGYDDPDLAPGTTVAALKSATQQGIAIRGIHYQVSVSASQFANSLQVVMGNYDGTFASMPVNVSGATRPDFYNDKLLVLEFNQPVTLDSRRAIALTVTKGETVTLTFYVSAYGS